MTTEQKLSFMQIGQELSNLNAKLLDAAKGIEDDDPAAEEVVQASTKLIQAQNNILKACK